MMQAIILAAGEGTRMRPLTLTKAKPLIEIAGKSILERTLDNLERAGCDNAVIVVGYKAEQIRERFGESHGRMRLSYVVQTERKGTGDALLEAERLAAEHFLVLYGDDYYSAEDIRACTGAGLCVAAKEHPEPQRFGVIVKDGNRMADLLEKPANPPSNLVNTGLYQLDRRIFHELRTIRPSPRGEIELTDGVKALAKKAEIRVVRIHDWIPIGHPWDMLTANEMLMKSELTGQEIDSSSEVSDRATIKGPVRIGKGSTILAGAYIQGPVIIGENCNVGPNCFIRHGTVLGSNVKIGNAVEVKNSMIGENTHIAHLSYVGDSIIGSNCNFGAGTVTANLRHDGRNVGAIVKGGMKDTGRRKVGVIMGDGCKTGINTSVYPGVSMGPFSWTTPGAIVRQSIGPFTLSDGKEQKRIEKDRLESFAKDATGLKGLQELYARLTMEESM